MGLAEYFERATRDDGTRYVTLRDNHPDWLQDAVYAAHDGEMPNDWRYEHCAHIAAAIDEGDGEAYDIADALTDTYTHDLMRWMCDNARWSYVDVHLEDESVDTTKGLEHIVRTAQFYVLAHMAQTMIDAWNEHETDETDETDEDGPRLKFIDRFGRVVSDPYADGVS